MSHHGFDEYPHISLEQRDAAIKRAHQLRSEAFGSFFRKVLDRRYRALNVIAEPSCATC